MCNLFLSVSNLSSRLSFFLSLDNLLDLNLHLMFFRSWESFSAIGPGFFSDLFLFAAPPVVSVSLPFRLGCFLLIDFTLLFNLDMVFFRFLGNLQFLFGCHFQYPCLSSSAQLLSSRHSSLHTSRPAVGTALSVLLILLLLGMLFTSAVGCALLCCWLCSSATLFS